MSFTLYKLAAEYRRIGEAIDDAHGELTPEIELALESVTDDIASKCDAIAALVRESTLEAEAIGDEIARLRAKQNARLNRAGRLKSYMLDALKSAGLSKVTGARFSVASRVASRPTIAWTGDMANLPEGFASVRVIVNADAAWQAEKAGTLPDGFHVSRTEYIEIR